MKSKVKITKPSPLIILTAGGTGGHVYPAEALAEELKKLNYRLILVTDKRGLNNYKGTLGEIPNYSVTSGPLIGKSKWQKLKSLCKISLGIIQSMWLIVRKRPACVVGFGGYASFPCSVAAILLGTDLVLHEQNSVMSRTNRFLSRYAELIAISFKKTKYLQPHKKNVLTGMPIRKSISKIFAEPFRAPIGPEKFNLLVLGGSQGAKIFSEVIPPAIKKLDKELQKKLTITQQCRKIDIEEVKKLYEGAECEVTISNFFENMPDLYQTAHLIISRSGASSVAEIAAARLPSILVPLPTAADDHQTSNANEFKQNKGGYVIAQKDFNSAELSSIISLLLSDSKKLETMSNNTKKFAITDAATRLAEQIEKKILKKKK